MLHGTMDPWRLGELNGVHSESLRWGDVERARLSFKSPEFPALALLPVLDAT